MKKVSIKDVAREAGVSVTTVSHILNHNDSRFSATTIKNVHAVSERLGYALINMQNNCAAVKFNYWRHFA
ncbi:ribose operon repressor, putative [Staphylococcus aureus]|uniref:Ribose operon repressor, putative n=1 Tax=Staphylococcus aureus TaxID=1280 RepID=A0A380EDE1_STAAU|nr:ribose operon repressor, putative [Staphylococcus aureus]